MQELEGGRKTPKTVRTISPDHGLAPERGQGTERRSAKAPVSTGASKERQCNRRRALTGLPPTGESPVDKAAKTDAVATLNEVFANTSVVVVAHYAGLTVAQFQKLRREMKANGATVKVAKNRLAKIALEGTDVASISKLLTGPTLIAYSNDPVAAPKVATAFAKDNDKLVILGGAMGKTALNPDGVKALATMPSLDELRAKLLGLIQAPATKIAQLSTAPAAKLARVFQAYADKDAA
ncbi:large subunit ribosomal protein L10 [Bosea sp. OAE506]